MQPLFILFFALLSISAWGQEIGGLYYYKVDGQDYYGTVGKIKRNGDIWFHRNGKKTYTDVVKSNQASEVSESDSTFAKWESVKYHFKVKGESHCVDGTVIASFANGKTVFVGQYLLERGYVAKIFADSEELKKPCEEQTPNHGLEKYRNVYN